MVSIVLCPLLGSVARFRSSSRSEDTVGISRWCLTDSWTIPMQRIVLVSSLLLRLQLNFEDYLIYRWGFIRKPKLLLMLLDFHHSGFAILEIDTQVNSQVLHSLADSSRTDFAELESHSCDTSQIGIPSSARDQCCLALAVLIIGT